MVITVREAYLSAVDPSFPAPQGLRIERAGVLSTPLNWYTGWKTKGGPEAGRRQGSQLNTPPARPGFLRRNLSALLQTPDRYWGWYWPAVGAGSRIIQSESIGAMLSSGPPWTSHLVARHLKKKYRIPWLADFRDAWASEPWRVGEDLPRWRDHLDRRLEASCLAWADRVLCTTDALRQNFICNNPALSADKFVTLPNGFDDAVAPPNVLEPKSDRRVLLHLGDLYGGRRIDTFCEAIASLAKDGRLNSFKVVFMGWNHPDIENSARQRFPELIRSGLIEFRPRVGWGEAQKALYSADILLLVQGDHKLAVPAKAYEYLQTGKPTFALAEEGALSQMLETTGLGVSVDPSDPRDIAARLLQVLELPSRTPEEVQRLASPYNFKSLTECLARHIRELAGASKDETSPATAVPSGRAR